MLRVASPPCMHAAMLCKTKTHIFFLSFFLQSKPYNDPGLHIKMPRSRSVGDHRASELTARARARSPAGMLAEAATKTSRSSSGLGRVQSTLAGFGAKRAARRGGTHMHAVPCRRTGSRPRCPCPPAGYDGIQFVTPPHAREMTRLPSLLCTSPSAPARLCPRRQGRSRDASVAPTSRCPRGAPRAARRDGPASRSSSTCVLARARPRVNVRRPRETPPRCRSNRAVEHARGGRWWSGPVEHGQRARAKVTVAVDLPAGRPGLRHTPPRGDP